MSQAIAKAPGGLGEEQHRAAILNPISVNTDEQQETVESLGGNVSEWSMT
jgi:hypothetical protein